MASLVVGALAHGYGRSAGEYPGPLPRGIEVPLL